MFSPLLLSRRTSLRVALLTIGTALLWLSVGHVNAAPAPPATIPDLAKLKLAAEAGDAKAQFEYGTKITFSNATESFAMILKSAQQGYGPAEETIGARYLDKVPLGGKERAMLERLAVRYTSRAAFKGMADAQARLSHCYQRGYALPKSPLHAYAWMAIAAKTKGGLLGYKANLDSLVARTPSDVIAEGQKLADSFRPYSGSEMNAVEADVLITQMKLSAIIIGGGLRGVVINQTRLYEGNTATLPLDGESVTLTCLKVEEKSVRLKMGGREFTLTK